MHKFLTIVLALLADSLFAQTSPQTGTQGLCEQENVQEHLKLSENRLSFKNSGGLFEGGVCWWHARFLRNASYLAYFSPLKEKPVWDIVQEQLTEDGKDTVLVTIPVEGSIESILKKIKLANEIVEIPGFSNLADFSHFYRKEIQKLLDGWQIEDGFVRQHWVIGLFGRTHTHPNLLAASLDNLYERVQRGEVVYQKLQLKGISAHAWPVIGMVKTPEGYLLEAIDSNFRELTYHPYVRGSRSLTHPRYGNFVPYTENVKEEVRVRTVRDNYCQSSETLGSFDISPF